ncbi:MAG: GTP-binding protein, partial [Deltaproteobacteria bacterium]|nr:GTP-binding protein [Deltaproteobacteria bacterium]
MFVLVLWLAPASATLYRGRIIDAVTKRPIAGAFVTLHDTVVQTDDKGVFQISGEGDQIGIRAYGYVREWIDLCHLQDGTQEIALEPLTPKALYLSFFGIGNNRLRQAALNLIEATELNALVIDVKGDRGMIAYPGAIPLAARVGAQNIITIKDLKDLIATLRGKGIYTIARIVTFKDNPLALGRPDLAVKTRNGNIWRDRERLAWTDPFKQEVRDYNIEVALEAARAGFVEIQLDYVRFPDKRG